MSHNIKLLCIFAAIFVIDALQVANGIGVNYGILGSDLSDPVRTIEVLKSRGVKKIRIFTPDQGILNALKGSGIEVFVGTSNEELPKLAQDASSATNWVQTNIAPHAKDVKISGITAGNELETNPLGAHVLGTMQNIDNALRAANINNVPVTTVVSYGVMGSSFPPSNGSISPQTLEFMTAVTKFLSSKGYPLLANIYPYFAHASNPNDVKADFALLKPNNPYSYMDGDKKYTNLFVAMVDALYSALEKIGAGNVNVIVSETGWPNAMSVAATVENAKEYNNNLVQLVESGVGTPKRPNIKQEAYIFAMYNENQKPAGIEQHWGMFNPNLQEVYHVDFVPQNRVLPLSVSGKNDFHVNGIDMDGDDDDSYDRDNDDSNDRDDDDSYDRDNDDFNDRDDDDSNDRDDSDDRYDDDSNDRDDSDDRDDDDFNDRDDDDSDDRDDDNSDGRAF